MALIKCPECKKEISDKSTKCIHCGNPIKKNKEVIKCSECNYTLDKNDKECPKCGCPVNLKNESNNSIGIKI